MSSMSNVSQAHHKLARDLYTVCGWRKPREIQELRRQKSKAMFLQAACVLMANKWFVYGSAVVKPAELNIPGTRSKNGFESERCC